MFLFHNILKDLTLKRRPKALVWSKGFRQTHFTLGILIIDITFLKFSTSYSFGLLGTF